MSRRTPKLNDEVSSAYFEVNPKDATQQSIKDGTMVTLTSRRGSIEVKAKVTDDVPEGFVFLTNPVLDPACGMPEYKVCAVKMEVSK